MTVEEICELAKRNSPLPKTDYMSEQWLYATLRLTYDGYRHGLIDDKQGKKEKITALKRYEDIKSWEKIFRRQAAVGKELGLLMSEANKSGCEICRKMAGLIDGRIVPKEV